MCCYVFSMRECLFPNEVQSKYMNSWAKTTSRYIAHRRFVLVVKWWCYCNIISFTNECMWKGAAWRFAKNSMCRRSHALAAHTSVLTLDHCKYRPHQQQQQGKKQQSTCVHEKAVDIFIVCMLCHALLWAIGSPLLSCSLLLLCGEKFHNSCWFACTGQRLWAVWSTRTIHKHMNSRTHETKWKYYLSVDLCLPTGSHHT